MRCIGAHGEDHHAIRATVCATAIIYHIDPMPVSRESNNADNIENAVAHSLVYHDYASGVCTVWT